MTGIQDRPFAIRFKVPQTRIAFNDLVKGPISFESAEIEDLVIIRSDGTPTYNFCVVVDDATMKITHVIRGDDHIANTPKQMLLYNALGYAPPSFAHLPMILGPDKTRLSKRHGATSVMAYKDMGYLPHALVNYLARLGWAMGDKEVFSMDELIAGFSLDACGKSSGVFNPDKLLWLNHHYIKEAPPEALSMLLIPFLKGLGIDATNDYRLLKITGTLRERAKTLKDMACQAEFYFKDRVQYEEKARKKYLTPETLQFLRLASDAIKTIDDFSATGLQARFEGLLKEKGISLGSIAQPVRVALTGGTVSPGIFEMISAMGREMCLKRLLHAMQSIEGRAETNS
jgi:glutamyl-tRNA synthetase